MRHRDLVPDVIPYSAAISAGGTGHVSQPALRLLDEMRQRDLEGSLYVCVRVCVCVCLGSKGAQDARHVGRPVVRSIHA